ncbi:hypothetical protein BGZ92_010501 [Podila epicladia]|nr:hypothetical protein BGZ92_010501 [Podila epicladia]
MQIPNFAELVNKQAKSYELIADSLSTLKSGKDTRTSWSRKKGSETVIPGAGGNEDPYGMTLYVKGMPLPLLLKRAELAVVDLKVLVKHSALAEPSKHLLVEQLESFHTRAKVAGRKLQFLQARANGCVDGLMIRNVYLTIELDRLEEEHRILKEQQVSNWGRIFNWLQVSLDAMDQILSTIHEITTKEKYHQSRENDKILAQLWSHLGGNRLEKSFHRNNLELLQDMEGQRKATVGQIQAALWKLTDFEAEIGILREKLVSATIDGALGRVGKEGATIKSSEGESDSGVSSPGSDASSLRSHIQQIELVTSRLKERSFLADALIKEQADLPSPASS